ncbi:MAG: endonuclease/exonuclease/phosphatase family protein [Anaerolineae bacterium]|nr:endonuclease/exonuclease/phosphatase family protein [Anaerolineae bacterium]
MPPLRVLTYNVHHWQGTEGQVDVARVTGVIRATEADIVALNEVYHPVSLPEVEGPPLAAMAHSLGMEYAFGPALPQKTFAGSEASYGNALLSRYPILAYATHRLTPVEGREPRSLLEVRVLPPSGKAFTLYVTHLDYKSEETRLAQASGLLLWTGRDRGRLHLLLGDLNALAPGDYAGQQEPWPALEAAIGEPGRRLDEPRVVPRLLRAGYVDAFAARGQGAGETYSTTRPLVRIDYIFIPEAEHEVLRSCQRWDAGAARVASDHFPVLAELDL